MVVAIVVAIFDKNTDSNIRKSSKPSSKKPKIDTPDKQKRSTSDAGSASLSTSSDPLAALPTSSSSKMSRSGRIKTPAELKFEEIQRQRVSAIRITLRLPVFEDLEFSHQWFLKLGSGKGTENGTEIS